MFPVIIADFVLIVVSIQGPLYKARADTSSPLALMSQCSERKHQGSRAKPTPPHSLSLNVAQSPLLYGSFNRRNFLYRVIEQVLVTLANEIHRQQHHVAGEP